MYARVWFSFQRREIDSGVSYLRVVRNVVKRRNELSIAGIWTTLITNYRRDDGRNRGAIDFPIIWWPENENEFEKYTAPDYIYIGAP